MRILAGISSIVASHLNHRQHVFVIFGPRERKAQLLYTGVLLSHLISLLTHWSMKPSPA